MILEKIANIELVQLVLEEQPFTRLIGAYLHDIDEHKVDLRVEIRPELLQQHGFVHGGVISYLADNSLTIAGGLVLGPKVVTGEYKINYLRPAIGGILSARAYAISQGKTQAVCRCDIVSINKDAEKVVAVAQGTINLLREV